MFQPPKPPRLDPIVLVWLAGGALAAAAYAIGPENVIDTVLDAIGRGLWGLRTFVHNLTTAGFDAMRAAAIGLLGVFILLSLLGIRRTGHGQGGMIVLTAVFLMLVWGAGSGYPGASIRWLIALVLALGGAVSATNRLRFPGGGGWRVPGRGR